MSDDITQHIRQALSALDPSTDEDWTAAGLPSMEQVRSLVGAEVTRKQVEAAAPGFTRATAAAALSPPVADAPPTPESAGAQPVAQEEPADSTARDPATALRDPYRSSWPTNRQPSRMAGALAYAFNAPYASSSPTPNHLPGSHQDQATADRTHA